MRLMAGVVLLMFPWAVIAGTPLPDGPHIVGSGEGRVSVKPDSARIVFRFEHRAEQALTAKQTIDKQVNALLEGTSRFGIAGDDVRASDLNTSEDVMHSREMMSAYPMALWQFATSPRCCPTWNGSTSSSISAWRQVRWGYSR